MTQLRPLSNRWNRVLIGALVALPVLAGIIALGPGRYFVNQARSETGELEAELESFEAKRARVREIADQERAQLNAFFVRMVQRVEFGDLDPQVELVRKVNELLEGMGVANAIVKPVRDVASGDESPGRLDISSLDGEAGMVLHAGRLRVELNTDFERLNQVVFALSHLDPRLTLQGLNVRRGRQGLNSDFELVYYTREGAG